METQALFAAGVLEKSYGSLYYLQITFLLIVSCGLVVMVLYWVAITVFRREQYAKQNAIGYSCVVFALMTISAVKQPGAIQHRGRHQIQLRICMTCPRNCM